MMQKEEWLHTRNNFVKCKKRRHKRTKAPRAKHEKNQTREREREKRRKESKRYLHYNNVAHHFFLCVATLLSHQFHSTPWCVRTQNSAFTFYPHSHSHSIYLGFSSSIAIFISTFVFCVTRERRFVIRIDFIFLSLLVKCAS